jgi:hypothetical protein
MLTFFIIWILGIILTGYIVWATEAEEETSIGDLILATLFVVFLWPMALVVFAHCYWTEHLRQKVVDFLNKKIRIKGGKPQESEEK